MTDDLILLTAAFREDLRWTLVGLFQMSIILLASADDQADLFLFLDYRRIERRLPTDDLERFLTLLFWSSLEQFPGSIVCATVLTFQL